MCVKEILREGMEKDFGSLARAGNALDSMRFSGILWTTLSLETSEVWQATFFNTLVVKSLLTSSLQYAIMYHR